MAPDITHTHHHGPRHQGSQWAQQGLRHLPSRHRCPRGAPSDPGLPRLHSEGDRACVPSAQPDQFAMAYYVINYSKLRIWEFVEYSKMIYLDGDIQVFQNIDHLFDYPDGYFYAVMDCFCEKTWSSSPQYKIGTASMP
ncbi:galactinol synthase 2 [Prunus yedoensis var. nudiflora]|uniref:Hexosyltransferase n=1 Tax=Prunus yedoensis var. nudiflora TaxID=2094558 RepID=A0A314XQ32_PRUYE|nr:galactinol synthase 2 [Prunus yedoensis var. nudiflora]